MRAETLDLKFWDQTQAMPGIINKAPPVRLIITYRVASFKNIYQEYAFIESLNYLPRANQVES